MKPHKWAKEIKAWADGAEIEFRNDGIDSWISLTNTKPTWEADEYRIKPQPKEPQYLYVWLDKEKDLPHLEFEEPPGVLEDSIYKYIGKIKLETEDE